MEDVDGATTRTFLAITYSLLAVAGLCLLVAQALFTGYAEPPIPAHVLWIAWPATFATLIALSYAIAKLLRAIAWITLAATVAAFPVAFVGAYAFSFAAACAGWTSHNCPFS